MYNIIHNIDNIYIIQYICIIFNITALASAGWLPPLSNKHVPLEIQSSSNTSKH